MLTPKDIEEKFFSAAHFAGGYAKKEVDAFLDEVRTELDRAQQGEAAAKAELRNLMNRQAQETVQISAVPAGAPVAVAPLPVESSITKILQRGQQLADEALAEAKVEAERLKAEAEVEVEKLKAAAQAEADKLLADAQAALADAQTDVASLSSAKDTAAKILQNALSSLQPPAA